MFFAKARTFKALSSPRLWLHGKTFKNTPSADPCQTSCWGEGLDLPAANLEGGGGVRDGDALPTAAVAAAFNLFPFLLFLFQNGVQRFQLMPE